jgi:hypothetical protein
MLVDPELAGRARKLLREPGKTNGKGNMSTLLGTHEISSGTVLGLEPPLSPPVVHGPSAMTTAGPSAHVELPSPPPALRPPESSMAEPEPTPAPAPEPAVPVAPQAPIQPGQAPAPTLEPVSPQAPAEPAVVELMPVTPAQEPQPDIPAAATAAPPEPELPAMAPEPPPAPPEPEAAVPEQPVAPPPPPQPAEPELPEIQVLTPPAPVEEAPVVHAPVEPAAVESLEPPPAPEPPAAPEPIFKLPVNGSHAGAFRVVVRLSDGDGVEVGEFRDFGTAMQGAQEVIDQLSHSNGSWPFYAGRFIRPDLIVSVDVVDGSAS